MSVPCGTNSMIIPPDIICCCASRLRPMWLTTALLTAFALTSFPTPIPGFAVSFAIMVRFFFRWCTSSSMTSSGLPMPINPPTIKVAPSGIISTACSSFMVRIFVPPLASVLLCDPSAV